jgi:hypothetical protein
MVEVSTPPPNPATHGARIIGLGVAPTDADGADSAAHGGTGSTAVLVHNRNHQSPASCPQPGDVVLPKGNMPGTLPDRCSTTFSTTFPTAFQRRQQPMNTAQTPNRSVIGRSTGRSSVMTAADLADARR